MIRLDHASVIPPRPVRPKLRIIALTATCCEDGAACAAAMPAGEREAGRC
jgi:hypothetical protein